LSYELDAKEQLPSGTISSLGYAPPHVNCEWEFSEISNREHNTVTIMNSLFFMVYLLIILQLITFVFDEILRK